MAEARIEILLANASRAGATLQDLQKAANALQKDLAKLPRNSQEFADKSKQFQQVSDELGKVRNQIKGTSAASDMLKDSFFNIIPFGGQLRSLGGAFTSLKGGVGGLIGSMNMLKTAMISTGIGALIVGVGLLINALSKMEPVVETIEEVMSGLGAIISELTQRAQIFIEAVGAFFSGDWDEAADKMSESFDGLADSIGNAYKAGVALAKLQDELEDKNREIAITNAEAEASIDRLIVQSRNRNKSIKEQNALLEEARQIAEKNAAKNLELEEKNMDVLLQEAALKVRLSKEEIKLLAAGQLEEAKIAGNREKIGKDLLQKITDQQVKMIQNAGQSNKLLEKINNEQAKREEKMAADRQQRADDEAKRQDDAAKKAQETAEKIAAAAKNIEDLKLAVMREGMDKQIALINSDVDRKIAALVGTEEQITEQRLLLEQDRANRVNKVWEDNDAKQKAKRIADQKAASELAFAVEMNQLNEQFLHRQITEEQYQAQAMQKTIDFKKEELEQIKEINGETSAEYQKLYGEILTLQQKQSDNAIANAKKEEEEKKQSVLGTLGVFGDVFGQLAAMQKKGSAAAKAFAVAQALMSTFQASINAYLSTVKIPFVGTTLAPIAAAAAFAFGMMNVNKIKNTPDEGKAALGKVIRGPSHARGGVKIEAEGDEIILTKGVYRNPMLRRAASMLNVMGGGRSFESPAPAMIRGPVRRYAAGGVPSADAGSMIDLSGIENRITELASAQDRRIDRIKVINVATETEGVIKTINSIQDEADI